MLGLARPLALNTEALASTRTVRLHHLEDETHAQASQRTASDCAGLSGLEVLTGCLVGEQISLRQSRRVWRARNQTRICSDLNIADSRQHRLGITGVIHHVPGNSFPGHIACLATLRAEERAH